MSAQLGATLNLFVCLVSRVRSTRRDKSVRSCSSNNLTFIRITPLYREGICYSIPSWDLRRDGFIALFLDCLIQLPSWHLILHELSPSGVAAVVQFFGCLHLEGVGFDQNALCSK